MRSLGFYPSEAEILDMITGIDLYGTGTIDFDQLLYIVCEAAHKEEENKEINLPNALVKEKKLTPKDLRELLKSEDFHMTEEEIDEIVKHAYTDKDGFIDWDIFMSSQLDS